MDAFASVLVHRHLMECADPVETTSRSQAGVLHVGCPIRLYTATNSRLVTEGFTTPLYDSEARGATEPIHRGSANEKVGVTLEQAHPHAGGPRSVSRLGRGHSADAQGSWCRSEGHVELGECCLRGFLRELFEILLLMAVLSEKLCKECSMGDIRCLHIWHYRCSFNPTLFVLPLDNRCGRQTPDSNHSHRRSMLFLASNNKYWKAQV